MIDYIKEHSNEMKHHCWTKPAAGWAKLNFDSGFAEEEKSGSWGAARWYMPCDFVSLGEHPTMPKCWSYNGCTEITSCPTTPLWSYSFRKWLLYSYFWNQWKRLQQVSFAWYRKRDKGVSWFSVRFRGVPRATCDGNRVAHSLAWLGRSESNDQVLFGSVPPCMVGLTIDDCSQIFVAWVI